MGEQKNIRIPGALILSLIALGIAIYAAVIANDARASAKENERYVDKEVGALHQEMTAYRQSVYEALGRIGGIERAQGGR